MAKLRSEIQQSAEHGASDRLAGKYHPPHRYHCECSACHAYEAAWIAPVRQSEPADEEAR